MFQLKFKTLISLAVVLFFLPFTVYGHGTTVSISYYGTTTITDGYLWADSTYNDNQFIDITVDGSGSGEVIWYDVDAVEISRSAVPATVSAPANAHALKLRSVDGGEIYAVTAHTNNPNSEHIDFEVPTTTDATNTDLLNALNQILESTNSNGEQLGSILSALNGIKNSIDQNGTILNTILSELQTTTITNYPTSPIAPTLEENKPPMNETPFEDNTIYFTDQGDSPTTEPIPVAPEPEQWKTGETDEFGNEILFNQETELIKDSTPIQEPELIKDSIPIQEPELIKDSTPIQEPELIKDSTPIQEPVLEKESELTKDPILTKEPSLSQDPVMTKDPVLIQEPIDNMLPNWKSN